jgi:hypothetical protein
VWRRVIQPFDADSGNKRARTGYLQDVALVVSPTAAAASIRNLDLT